MERLGGLHAHQHVQDVSPVPCRLCLLLIYNAYPDHDKVQNWERRCGCVAHLCGCYKTMTSKVEDRSVQLELPRLWQEQPLLPATLRLQGNVCKGCLWSSTSFKQQNCLWFNCGAVMQSLKDQQLHATKKSTSPSLGSTA